MADLSWRPVFSSFISHIAYDGSAKAFHVRYRNGGETKYAEVPPDVADRVYSSPSIGEALHRELRGQYSHEHKK